MKKLKAVVAFALALSFWSCTVTESIVFEDDNSGRFLVNYDMGQIMSQFGDMMKPDDDDDSDNLEDEPMDTQESEKAKKSMDTTIVISELMAQNKDSIAALPEEKRLVLEAIQDMYITMNMDEEEEKFNFGVGIDFESLDQLVGMQDKLKMARSLNNNEEQLESVKQGPMGTLMGNDDQDVAYGFSQNEFTRTTTLPENYKVMDSLLNSLKDNDKGEFSEMFMESHYVVKLTFPRKIKSANIEDYELSDDEKTISYKLNWIDYLADPKALDVKVQLKDE